MEKGPGLLVFEVQVKPAEPVVVSQRNKQTKDRTNMKASSIHGPVYAVRMARLWAF
jgi:hypothetical protein